MVDPREYEDDASADVAAWLDWPQCPICARRRQARCPTCGYASADFPLAEYQEFGAEPQSLTHEGGIRFADAEADEAVLLVCPVCEEAFLPRFYDHCAACGYDYGGGIHVDGPDPEGFSPRAFWATAGVAGVMLALIVFFWAIVQR
jgi:hypothetical protein